MTKILRNYTNARLARAGASGLLLCAVVLALSALMAQSPKTEAKPTEPEFNKEQAKAAFTATLTRAAHDEQFRKRLLKCDSAREAVVEEGKRKFPSFDIPTSHVVVFFEAEKSRSNHNYHVFSLPAFNSNDTAEYQFDKHLLCCYDPW